MPTLFDPIDLGDLRLPNRVFMAPLTRSRAGQGRVPTDLMRDYYVQRATAGLILSEATSVTPQGVGYADTPGIWSPEQVEGWRKITAAVHDAGGHIFLQLWHVGRKSDPLFLDGQLPVAPSAVRPNGHLMRVLPPKSYVTPRALERAEIPGVIEAFRQGARNAQAAGFDGVEIHGANGYLFDQFLADSTNQREDEYGGPIENRVRLMLEVTDACTSIWGANRVGMHLAPRGDNSGVIDSDPGMSFGYVARELGRRRIAFICAREHLGNDRIGPRLKQAFGGVYVVNEQFSKADAQSVLTSGEADAVAFGVPYIANPDLVRRFELDAPLNVADPATFYEGGPNGYVDYPVLGTANA